MTAQRRVLVVENDWMILSWLRRCLEGDGWNVHAAASIAAANAELTKEDAPFALAVVDVNLDDGSGADLREQWRERVDHWLMVSGDDRTLAQLDLDGARDDFLLKPISIAGLRQAVARLTC